MLTDEDQIYFDNEVSLDMSDCESISSNLIDELLWLEQDIELSVKV